MLLCCSVTHSPSSGPNTSFVSKRTIFITLQCTDLSCFSSPKSPSPICVAFSCFFPLVSFLFPLFSQWPGRRGVGGNKSGGIAGLVEEMNPLQSPRKAFFQLEMTTCSGFT